MANVMFGSGALYLKDANGNSIQVGVLQDVSVEFSSDTKELMGGNQYPIAVVASGKKVSGKAKFAQIDGALIQSIAGGTVASGTTLVVNNESKTASASVQPTNRTTFVEDLGVLDSNLQPMKKVATAPAAVGEYQVTGSAGTTAYVFFASQTGNVYLNYTYTATSGSTLTINNQLMGTQTTFTCILSEAFNGKTFSAKFFAVMAPKIAFSFKNDDFTTEDIDLKMAQDSSGKVAEIYFS